MAMIRSYNQPAVEARGIPGAAVPMAAPVGAFGNPAQAMGDANVLVQAGAQLGQAAQSIDQILERERAIADETVVQEQGQAYQSERRKLLYTNPDAFYSLKGEAAIKAMEPTMKRLDELKQNYLANTNNDRQRRELNKRLGFFTAEAEDAMGRYVGQQSLVWKDSVAKGQVRNALDEAAVSYNDPANVTLHLKGAAQIEYDRVIKNGGSPEEATAMARSVTSNGYKSVIQLMALKDPAAAQRFFEANRDKFDAADLVAIEGQIQTIRTSITAQAQATAMLSGLPETEQAKKGTQQSLQFWTSDGYTQKVSAGITAGFLRESQFSPGAVNPRDGRDGSDSINIGQWNQARATAFKDYARKNGLDPNDMATGLKYAKAEIDGEIPYSISGLSPDFKARLQNAKTEKEAADIMTRGYFRPKYTEGESAHRQNSASQILAKYGDPLRDAVNDATGSAPSAPAGNDQPKNGPQYVDTRKMLLDADAAYDLATRRNMEINATNEPQRRATQAQLEMNLAMQKRQIEMTKLQLDINVDKWMQTGGPNGTAATTRPPPEIWNQLHYEKQKSIDATLVHNAKGTDAVTDQQAWYELQRGLTSADPKVREEYANKPLWEYKAKLSNQDFQEIAKMQGAARKGDPDKNLTHVRNINQMVDDTLLKLGVDTTPKPGATDATKALQFRRLAQDKITALEVETGKKSTPEQQQKIIDSLAINVVTKPGILWDSTKSRYEMTIKDVPDAEKSKITDALKRGGIPVTDETIIDLFARKNAKAPK